MGKIVYIMGKSSTGKDTIFKQLLKNSKYHFKTIVSYTTRPIRESEHEGVEYHFVNEDGYRKLKDAGKVVEERHYDTCKGLWRYFTVDDGSIDLSKEDYITIGTLESYRSVCRYFGKDKVVPVLIELDDGIRLLRAINREKKQDHPAYEELCRRFLADSADFSEEKIIKARIAKRFKNEDLEQCLNEIDKYLFRNLA